VAVIINKNKNKPMVYGPAWTWTVPSEAASTTLIAPLFSHLLRHYSFLLPLCLPLLLLESPPEIQEFSLTITVAV